MTAPGPGATASLSVDGAARRVLAAQAADLVERVGLWQGHRCWPGWSGDLGWVYRPGDPVSLLGAVWVAAGLGGPDLDLDEAGHVVGSTARAVVTVADAWDALARHLGTDGLDTWSDTPGRTAAEVAAALRATTTHTPARAGQEPT